MQIPDIARREQIQTNSRIKRDKVMGFIRDALSYDHDEVGIGRSIQSLHQVREYLNDDERKATESKLSEVKGLGDNCMTREDKDYCRKEYRSTWDTIKIRQKENQQNNYSKIKQALNPISDLAYSGDPNEALNKIKKIYAAMINLRMRRYHYRALHKLLNEYWKKAIERILNERKKRRQEDMSKIAKLRSDMRALIESLYDIDDELSVLVNELNSDREKIVNMRNSARSDDERNQIDGLIDKAVNEILTTLDLIAKSGHKIDEVTSKLV